MHYESTKRVLFLHPLHPLHPFITSSATHYHSFITPVTLLYHSFILSLLYIITPLSTLSTYLIFQHLPLEFPAEKQMTLPIVSSYTDVCLLCIENYQCVSVLEAKLKLKRNQKISVHIYKAKPD